MTDMGTKPRGTSELGAWMLLMLAAVGVLVLGEVRDWPWAYWAGLGLTALLLAGGVVGLGVSRWLAVPVIAVVLVGGYLWVDPTPWGTPGWTISKDRVLLGRDGDVLVFDDGGRGLDDGDRAWETDDGTVRAVTDGVALVTSGEATVRGVEAATGERLWERDVPELFPWGAEVRFDRPVASAAEQTFVVQHSGDEAGGLALDARTGETRWQVSEGWLAATTELAPAVPFAAYVVHGSGEPEDGRDEDVRAVASGEVVRRAVHLDDRFAVSGTTLVTSLTGKPTGQSLTGASREWQSPTLFAVLDVVAASDATVDDGQVHLLTFADGEDRVVPLPSGWEVFDDSLDGPWLLLHNDGAAEAWHPANGDRVALDGGCGSCDGDDAGRFVSVRRPTDRLGRDYAHVVTFDGETRRTFDWASSTPVEVSLGPGVALLRNDEDLRVVPLG